MAAFNLNRVILGGRLTHTPELKTTASGISVCSFTVAINRRIAKGEESKADFIDCVAWRETAEFVSRYFVKASSICVEGYLQQRSWEAKDGTKRTVTEVQVDRAYFVDAKSEMPGAQERPAQMPYIPESYTAPMTPPPAPKYEELDSDEPLPF